MPSANKTINFKFPFPGANFMRLTAPRWLGKTLGDKNQKMQAMQSKIKCKVLENGKRNGNTVFDVVSRVTSDKLRVLLQLKYLGLTKADDKCFYSLVSKKWQVPPLSVTLLAVAFVQRCCKGQFWNTRIISAATTREISAITFRVVGYENSATASGYGNSVFSNN